MKNNKGKVLNPEVLTYAELTAFLRSFRPTNAGVRNRAIFSTCAFSGLRIDEALSLRVCDVDLEKQRATVISGKGSKRRVVGIGAPAIEQLREWLKIRPESARFFFCTESGGKICDGYIRRTVIKHAKRAGIKHRVHTHSFRHTAACLLADAGVDIRIIQQQLGHSNLSTTDRYLSHINPTRTLEAIRNMDWGG